MLRNENRQAVCVQGAEQKRKSDLSLSLIHISAVKKALEALDGVAGAEVSHEKGTAVVTLEKDVDNAVLTKAVEDKDYKVVSVQ